jgi:hypothetical protein
MSPIVEFFLAVTKQISSPSFLRITCLNLTCISEEKRKIVFGHILKEYRGIEVLLHSVLTSPLDGDESQVLLSAR